MSISELVFWYAIIFLILLAALVFVMWRRKATGKIVFPRPDWALMLDSLKRLGGEFWLKVFITVVITASSGVMIAVFVLPYGTALALVVLVATLLGLIFFVPKFLA